MRLRHLFEQAPAKKIVAVMPGGFHPFHPGHKSLYDWAVETFGRENVYVAATNDTKSRPFPFDVKQKLAGMAGVPADRFIQVKSPFNALSYDNIIGNPAETALVFVRSEKDKTSHPLPDQVRKSDGMMGYLVSYKGNEDLETADTHGYLAYGPTIDFDFSGMSIKSASELRAAWPEMSQEDKLQAADLMYPGSGDTAAQLLDKALGVKDEVPAESLEESEVVIDPTQLREYLRMLIDDAIDKEQDIDKLSRVLKILVGKEIRSRGKRYSITSEDVITAFEASCKNRRKKMREASNPNLERAIALAMQAQNLLQGSVTGGDEMDTTVVLSPSAKKKANEMITQAQKLSGLSVEKLIDLGQRQLDKDAADISAKFNESRSEELPDGSTKYYAADGSYTHSGAWGKKFYDANGKLIKTQTPTINGLSTIKYADGTARYIFSGGGLEARGPLEGNKPGEADYLQYAFGGTRFIFDARKGQPVIKGNITIGRLEVALTGKVLDRPAFHKNPRQMMSQILGGDPLAILKDPMAAKPMVEKGTAKLYFDGKEISPEQLAQAVKQGL